MGEDFFEHPHVFVPGLTARPNCQPPKTGLACYAVRTCEKGRKIASDRTLFQIDACACYLSFLLAAMSSGVLVFIVAASVLCWSPMILAMLSPGFRHDAPRGAGLCRENDLKTIKAGARPIFFNHLIGDFGRCPSGCNALAHDGHT